MDQPILPKLISFFILISCLLDIILKVWGEILSRSLVGLFRIKIGDFIILQWLKYSYAFKCNKKIDENVILWNTYNGKTITMGKPVAGGLCLQCFNFHGKCFSLKAGIPEFSKMIEISCLQVMKSKLTTILNAWHTLQIHVSCVYLLL